MTHRRSFAGRWDVRRALAKAGQDSMSEGLVRYVVSGEAGIGRTALLDQFVHDVELQGGLAIRLPWGRADHDDATKVAGDLAHALAARLPGEGAHRDALLRAGAAADMGWERALVEAVRSAIDVLTDEALVVLTVDDVHRASSASLEFLQRVTQVCACRSVVLVLSVRLGESAQAPAELARLLLGGREIVLSGLTEQQATTMLSDRLGRRLDNALATACHRATAGNPFLLDALSAWLMAGDALPEPTAVHKVVLPGVVEYLLGPALCADLNTVRLAETIAVAGRFGSVDTAMAAHLSGLGLVDALKTLDLLVRMRLVADNDAVELRHPLLRVALTGGMTLMARNAVHLTTAAYLHEHGAPADMVAAHLSASTVPQEGAWPAGVMLRAADIARRKGHHDIARRYLTLVVDSASGHEQSEAMLELVDLRGEPDAVSGLEAVVGMLPMARDEFVLRRLISHIGRTLSDSDEENQPILDAIGAALAGTALRGWDRAYRTLCRVADEPPPAAAKITSTLAERPEAHGGALMAAASGLAAGYRHVVNDDPRAALRFARVALEREIDELDTQPLALLAALTVLVESGYPAEAAAHLRKLDDEAYGPRYTQRPDVLFVRAQIAFAEGNLTAAENELNSALAALPPTSGRPGPLRTRMVGLLALVLLCEGRTDDAEALLRRYDGPERRPDSWWAGNLLFASAFLRAGDGDLHRAAADLTELWERATEMGLGLVGSAPWRIYGVGLLAQVGYTGWARQAADSQVRFAEDTGSPLERGRGLRALAQVATDGTKEELLREAVAVLEPTRGQLDLAYAAGDLGRVLAQQKRRDEAVTELTRAARLADQCGAIELSVRIRQQVLASHEHPSLRGVLSLTAREREILIDAVRGMTNRKISEFREITVRTVELHLSSAYRKLGISGRDDFPEAFRNRALWTLITDGQPVVRRSKSVGSRAEAGTSAVGREPLGHGRDPRPSRRSDTRLTELSDPRQSEDTNAGRPFPV
ncbi:AAA family ATPase [Streptomyces sp. NPDC005962]|uniref:helix-turn-helix transcriptional regulator n=1 Tax=Streptomyces sp. NPDC005962 TaxID=3154466 RepID=UPI003410DEFB